MNTIFVTDENTSIATIPTIATVELFITFN
jgi:hypothetical protein